MAKTVLNGKRTISHTRLCAALKVSRARVDQWLSRGFIKLEIKTSSGRERQWTERDVLKLVALWTAADSGLPLDLIAPHLLFLTRMETESYLTIYNGPHRLAEGSRVIDRKELIELLAGLRVAIVLPLHSITERVDRIFSEARSGSLALAA